jgi:hypothetical protein
VIFVVSWIGPLAHRIGESYGGKNFNDTTVGYILLYADTMGLSFQSFLTSMLWLSFPDFINGFVFI